MTLEELKELIYADETNNVTEYATRDTNGNQILAFDINDIYKVIFYPSDGKSYVFEFKGWGYEQLYKTVHELMDLLNN